MDGDQEIAISTQPGGGHIPSIPDALQEVRLLTSNSDAEFGRSSGRVFSATPKSDTLQFHRLLYGYIRNNPFHKSTSILKGVNPLKQNKFDDDFSWSLWHLGEAFSFPSYKGLVIHTPATISANVVIATAPHRRSYCNHSSIKLTKLPKDINCETGAAPVICKFALVVIAENVLTSVPVFDETTHLGMQQSARSNNHVNQGLARIHSQLPLAQQVEAMFFALRGADEQPNAVGNQVLTYSGMGGYENTYNVVLVDIRGISPRSVNSIRFFHTPNRSSKSSLYPDHTWASLGGTPIASGAPFSQPYFAVNGYFNDGSNHAGPNDNTQVACGPVETLTLTRRRHSIDAGGAFVWSKYAFSWRFQDSGILTFCDQATGNALADFLVVEPSTFFQLTSQIFHTHLANPALFANHSWQVYSHLNLLVGISWEINLSAVMANEITLTHEMQSQIASAVPTGPLNRSDRGIPPRFYKTPYTNFAPQIDFANDFSGNGRTGPRSGVRKSDSSYHGLISVVDRPPTLGASTNSTPHLMIPLAPMANTHAFDVASRELLNGLQIDGITLLHSGPPLTVAADVASCRKGVVNDRPDGVGTATLPTSRFRLEKIRRFFDSTRLAVPRDPMAMTGAITSPAPVVSARTYLSSSNSL